MGILINQHLEVGGHNFVLVIAFLLAALYFLRLIRAEWGVHDGVLGILMNRSQRFIAGFAIMALGVVIRIGGWFGWRPFLYAGDLESADIYKSFSVLWTGAGEILAVAGLTMLAWPYIRERLGRHAVSIVVLLTVLCWWTGVALTWLLSFLSV